MEDQQRKEGTKKDRMMDRCSLPITVLFSDEVLTVPPPCGPLKRAVLHLQLHVDLHQKSTITKPNYNIWTS